MKIITTICLSLLLFSCDVFQTRTPEEPDFNQSNNLPQTTPENLVSNFQNAFLDKNADNYKNCFWTNQGKENYNFQAASESTVQFGSYFENWDANSEKRYFLSILSNLSAETSINLEMTYKPFITYPDSIVASGSYKINFQTGLDYTPNNFMGKFQFTFRQNSQNYWYIYRWVDISTTFNDTLQTSWSNLKASYGN